MKPKFIADVNVGKLARWLRIMGYDTLFFRDGEDEELVKIAMKEDRILLTKDTGFLRRKEFFNGELKVLLLKDDDFKKQLLYVVKSLDLKDFSPFSLCIECNESLVEKRKEEVKGLVPPYVYRTQDKYMMCPSCGRVYWRGTHWERMRRELEDILRER